MSVNFKKNGSLIPVSGGSGSNITVTDVELTTNSNGNFNTGININDYRCTFELLESDNAMNYVLTCFYNTNNIYILRLFVVDPVNGTIFIAPNTTFNVTIWKKRR